MRVLCTLPNTSTLISGVRFTQAPEKSGWISDDLTPALAEAFAQIPGYQLLAEESPEPTGASSPAPAAARRVETPPVRPASAAAAAK